MTWTYSNSPATNERDEVRLLIQDVDYSDPLISDEEVLYFISKGGAGIGAAYLAALSISAKFGRLADERTGQVEVKWSQRSRAYAALAADLKKQMALSTNPLPYAGGISVSDIKGNRAKVDRSQETFSLGMTDNTNFII